MPKIRVGTSGWSYKDWEDIVYPKNKARSALPYMAEYFDAIEINTSFYRPPSPRYCAKWARDVEGNPDFMFAIKLWQRFTHEREQAWSPEEVRVFREGIGPIAEAGRLGALLLQFPWSFPNNEANRCWLLGVAEAFREYPLVMEVRHRSWENDPSMAFLKENRLNFCNIDQPASIGSIGPTSVATGPLAYYRFHGRNAAAWFAKDAGRDARYDYLYREEELDPWVRDIREMEKRVEQIYVMMNNHYRGQAPVNALQVRSALSGERVKVPVTLIEYYPILKRIAK